VAAGGIFCVNVGLSAEATMPLHLGQYLRPGRLSGRIAHPKKFEAEHLAKFRDFILREIWQQDGRLPVGLGIEGGAGG